MSRNLAKLPWHWLLKLNGFAQKSKCFFTKLLQTLRLLWKILCNLITLHEHKIDQHQLHLSLQLVQPFTWYAIIKLFIFDENTEEHLIWFIFSGNLKWQIKSCKLVHCQSRSWLTAFVFQRGPLSVFMNFHKPLTK